MAQQNNFKHSIISFGSIAVILGLALFITSTASAQTALLKTTLVNAGVVPASSVNAAVYPLESACNVSIACDTGQTGLDGDSDNFLDTSLADLGTTVGTRTLGVVDWVEVQLRIVSQGTTAAPTARTNQGTYIKAGLLLSDGSIVDADTSVADMNSGAGVLTIPLDNSLFDFDASTHDLFVAVNHRNHLAVLSATKMTTNSNGEYVFDFTAAQDAAVGGANALVEGSDNGTGQAFSGKYAMIAGDVDGSGGVNANDANNSLTPALGTSGYSATDIDFNNSTNSNDANNFLIPNTGRGIQFTY